MGPNTQNPVASASADPVTPRSERRQGRGLAPRGTAAPRSFSEARGRGYLRADIAGQFASVLFGVIGILIFVRAAAAAVPADRLVVLLVTGVVACVVSLVAWFLPWERILPARAFLVELLAFAIIGVANWADPNPWTYGATFGLVFVWIGLVRPIGATAFAVAPATVAYLVPLVFYGPPANWWIGAVTTLSLSVLMGIALSAAGEQLRRAELQGRRRVTGLESILSSTVELAQPLEPETVVAMTADIGMRAFGADAVILLGADETPNTMRVLEQRHWVGIERGAAFPCTSEFVAQLAAGEAMALPAGIVEATPETGGEAQVIPLTSRNGLAGALIVWWRWSVKTNDRRIDADLASVFALQAGSALERAYTFGELQSATLVDPLTGLGNRRAADMLLAALEPGDGVVMIDLDHFKRVNDEFGHPAGDKALRDLGGFLASSLRDGDRVARYGGEEFIMFVRKIHPAAVESLLERLRLLWNERGPITTFSIGAAVHQSGADPRITLQAADIALYQAKERGRDRVVVAA